MEICSLYEAPTVAGGNEAVVIVSARAGARAARSKTPRNESRRIIEISQRGVPNEGDPGAIVPLPGFWAAIDLAGALPEPPRLASTMPPTAAPPAAAKIA